MRTKVFGSGGLGSVILDSGLYNSGFNAIYFSVVDSMAQVSVTLGSESLGLEFCDSRVFASWFCGSKFCHL